MNRALVFDHLTVRHADHLLVSLHRSVMPGEVLTIMGPSGSGKSTALAAIMGTLPPAFTLGGSIRLGEIDITALAPHQRHVGLLFQDDILFPHLSVGENLGFGLTRRIKGRIARNEAIEAALEQAGLGGFANRDPSSLSGGQRSRVALMRAILAEPSALLLDEPFSRLDSDLRQQIRHFVLQTIRQKSIPAVLVTHDLEDGKAAGGVIVNPLGQVMES